MRFNVLGTYRIRKTIKRFGLCRTGPEDPTQPSGVSSDAGVKLSFLLALSSFPSNVLPSDYDYDDDDCVLPNCTFLATELE